MLERLWSYQRERFPLGRFALLALAVGTCATSYSALLRGSTPSASSTAAASGSALLLWLQMRVLDEFKDADDDARFRPYRAVPRGLVTLGELRGVLLVAGALGLGLALTADAALLLPLFATWAWLGLTAVEFGVGGWLRARPGIYMATHCPGGLVICLYLSAYDWVPASVAPRPALLWMGLAALLATIVLEIGRKLRAPRDEEVGVVTYSAAWGRPRATAAWLAALAATAVLGSVAAGHVGIAAPFAAVMGAVVMVGACAAAVYLRHPKSAAAHRLETVSAFATLLLFTGLGPAALLLARLPWVA